MEAGQACALYCQRRWTTVIGQRRGTYTRKSGKLLKVMPLHPTEKHALLPHYTRPSVDQSRKISRPADSTWTWHDTLWAGDQRRHHIGITSDQPRSRTPRSHGCCGVWLQSWREEMRKWKLQLPTWEDLKHRVGPTYCTCNCSDLCFKPFKKEENETPERS